ncbi:MAG: Gfo/Idh/MocA family oxidoreductase [Deltaproteobacteria bacterium]|nr:Gfo/Idh/MocA family oxidoreductase [Deltaproteobacteria bacterium]MBW1962736.1 Gfo/Idh/MocA family oxidoreductase [Deltaproteobacteria bacterium]MBW1994006.1 Gfo/Idh/MocA family oxidoreductase [Deltaproteobacteria bacterium]MBW2150842.1 Gfo/Idh/MocA family oxidoreductase [Deltaproteobacteria bacterium]
MKKLKVGVIGVGYLGKFHAAKYAKMADVDLVAVVDINKARAVEIARQYGTTAYFRHQDIADKVDAVSIVVPTADHFGISKYFLEHDVDVLIEKPMATTIEEADELIGFADSRGLLIQVGHLERFNPAVVALQGIVKKPMFIESHRLSIYQPRGTDVSVVLDLMIHDIDIILNYVQSEVKSIHAAGIPVISRHVDIANARLEFKSGCVANVTASRISTRKERKIRMFQRDAYISVDFANHEITIISQNGSHGAGIIPGMDIKRLCFTKADALEDELASFVKAVRNRQPPSVTGQMGRDALSIALDIMDQIQASIKRFLQY